MKSEWMIPPKNAEGLSSASGVYMDKRKVPDEVKEAFERLLKLLEKSNLRLRDLLLFRPAGPRQADCTCYGGGVLIQVPQPPCQLLAPPDDDEPTCIDNFAPEPDGS